MQKKNRAQNFSSVNGGRREYNFNLFSIRISHGSDTSSNNNNSSSHTMKYIFERRSESLRAIFVHISKKGLCTFLGTNRK